MPFSLFSLFHHNHKLRPSASGGDHNSPLYYDSDSDNDQHPKKRSFWRRRLKSKKLPLVSTERRISPGQAHMAMSENNKVLVYHYRADSTSILPGGKGLEAIKHSELEKILKENDELIKVTTKPIPKGAGSVEIHQKDLTSDATLRPNDEQNVAAVSFPFKVQLSSALTGKYDKLYILSRKYGGEEAASGERC